MLNADAVVLIIGRPFLYRMEQSFVQLLTYKLVKNGFLHSIGNSVSWGMLVKHDQVLAFLSQLKEELLGFLFSKFPT